MSGDLLWQSGPHWKFTRKHFTEWVDIKDIVNRVRCWDFMVRGPSQINPCDCISATIISHIVGGLCKTLFKEIESDCSPERCEECVERSPVIRKQDPPSLELRDCALNWRTVRADLVIVLMLAYV